mgnify:CR=1 FL=1
MKHTVATLEGALLDAAVAKAEGLPVHPGRGDWIVADSLDTVYADEKAFSRVWAYGGPIIERERISTNPAEGADDQGSPGWKGWASYPSEPAIGPMYGPTMLISAMRAFVFSRLGEDVELP